jgi:phage FluMu protein Com
MPIHFRCAFCNQLLGIARRKSGSVINCPTCGGPLVVPRMPSDDEKSESNRPATNRLLEECDFDVILKPPEPAHAVGASVLGTTPGSAAPVAPSPMPKSPGSSALTHSGNGSGPSPPPKPIPKPESRAIGGCNLAAG